MRLDKYLKISRLIKRRTVANEACDAGRVLVNGKVARASYDVKQGDVLVLSGSIPAAVGSDIYERIMERLRGRGVRIVVDAEKELLSAVLHLNPFLIKPNNHELGQMFGKELKTEEEFIAHARILRSGGRQTYWYPWLGTALSWWTKKGRSTGRAYAAERCEIP